MLNFRDIDAEIKQFHRRVLITYVIIAVTFLLLLLRLGWLQVVRYDELSSAADKSHIAIIPIAPIRGTIIDRNGVELVTNYSAFTLEISPEAINDINATIQQLSEIIPIDARDIRRFQKQLEEPRNLGSIPIRSFLNATEVARFSAQSYRFRGVEIKARLFRNYPYKEIAAHALGYIGRINTKEQAKIEEEDLTGLYLGTENIGKRGIEQSYERALFGKPGYRKVVVNVHGTPVKQISEQPAETGAILKMTLDIGLQSVVEKLYQDRRGSLVALDPNNGEILAYVSRPAFDPNHFVAGIDSKEWSQLLNNPYKPLLNRAIASTYPPASTYKPFLGLIALMSGRRTAQQTIRDPGYFIFGGNVFRDDKPGGHGQAVNMVQAIAESCDTYFYMLANDMGVDNIYELMRKFGFGQISGIDIAGEVSGILPSTAWKSGYFKGDQRKWYPGETISLGIGQGYNAFTILQLARATAMLANGGRLVTPHLVKASVDFKTQAEINLAPNPLQESVSEIPTNHLNTIYQGMELATQDGTARVAFLGAKYRVAGKTGTAQVFSLKGAEYDHQQVPENLRDHALFIAFAPIEAPKIALALIVENAGFGAKNAAPIARAAFDYYLNQS